MDTPEDLAARVRQAIADGQKIEAIRLFREATGLGLAESKEAVERIAAGDVPAQSPAVTTVETPVQAAIRAGQKIQAIKLYRAQTGADLASAKTAVEQLQAEMGLAPARAAKGAGCAASVLLFAGIAGGAVLLFRS